MKLVFEQTRRHHNSLGVPAGSDRTWHTLYALEATFDIVRLGFTYDAATDCTVVGAAIAPSARVNDDINPVDATGAPVAWTRVSFKNRGLDIDYGAQLATAPPSDPVHSIMLNTAPEDDDQKMPVTWSDWMPVSSLPRADGGTLPLLMVRANLTGSPRPAASSPGAGWDGVAQGRIVRSYVNPGDCVSRPQSFTSRKLQAQMTPVLIQYLTRSRGFSIMAVGDSCLAGGTSQDNANNFVFQAAIRLSRPTRPVSPINFGFRGMSFQNYFWNAFNAIDDLQPSVVVIQMGSRNATSVYSTLSQSMKVFRRGMALAQRVREYGGTPVLVTPWPDRTETIASDENRLAVCAAVRECAQSGVLMVDADALLGVDGSPRTLKPGCTDDDLHINDAGHAILAAALVEVLAPLIAHGPASAPVRAARSGQGLWMA